MEASKENRLRSQANERRSFFRDWPFHREDDRAELFACQRDGLTRNDLSGIKDTGPWTHSFTPGWGDPSSDPIGDIRKAMEYYRTNPQQGVAGPVAHYTVKDEVQSDQNEAMRYATLYHSMLPTPDRRTTIIT